MNLKVFTTDYLMPNITITGLKVSGKIDTLALGVFDGMHLGHQQLLENNAYALTLYPHPAHVLKKNKHLPILSTPREMRKIYSRLLVLKFTPDICKLTWDAFLDQVVKEQIRPKRIVVGFDYHFGNRREGNFKKLSQWAKKNGISVTQIDPFSQNGTLIKSTLIRESIVHGNFNQAVELLGHPYLICGSVIKGKTMGYPTANLTVPKMKLLPKNGVYKGFVNVGGRRYTCGIYIGTKPTFNGKNKQVEVFLVDYDGNLYNRQLALYVTEFVRPEMTFNNTEALKDQIRNDLNQILK
jgi:riboflavin kinase/FMN adenylyltransferase